jgi:hypothetical protein
MKLKFILATASLAAATILLPPPARAETLDTSAQLEVVRVNAPSRGMSMAQVQSRFGAPLDKLPAAGGDTPRHPVINRWRYNGYTVYFERNRVIHSVLELDAAAPAS